MYSLLHMRINLDHLPIKLPMIPHQHLGIPRHGHKQRVNPTRNRRRKDIGNLQTYNKRKGDDDGGELAVGVVGRVGEDEVEVGEQGAGVGDEGGAHGEDGADEAFVDEGVDAAVFYHSVYTKSQRMSSCQRERQGKGSGLRAVMGTIGGDGGGDGGGDDK